MLQSRIYKKNQQCHFNEISKVVKIIQFKFCDTIKIKNQVNEEFNKIIDDINELEF